MSRSWKYTGDVEYQVEVKLQVDLDMVTRALSTACTLSDKLGRCQQRVYGIVDDVSDVDCDRPYSMRT